MGYVEEKKKGRQELVISEVVRMEEESYQIQAVG